MTREEYLNNLKQISDAGDAVDSEYEKVDNLSSTLCEVNQVMSYNPSMQVVRTRGGKVVGYDYKYTSPESPNTTGMSMDSNIDSGLYASGGGGSTRGGGAGRARYYAGGVSGSSGTDKLTGTGLVSGTLSAAWGAASVLGKMGMRVYGAAKDFVAEVGDSFADRFEDLLIPTVEKTADYIRILFGADPETGETIMYMDEDTIGALAISSRDAGAFDTGVYHATLEDQSVLRYRNWQFPINYVLTTEITYSTSPAWENRYYRFEFSRPVYFFWNNTIPNIAQYWIVVSDTPFTYMQYIVNKSDGSIYSASGPNNPTSGIRNNITFYVGGVNLGRDVSSDVYANPLPSSAYSITPVTQGTELQLDAAYIIYYGTTSGGSPVDGLTPDPAATSPVDAITGADPHVVASQLAQQYPGVMGSPMQVTVMDDSCNQQTITYYSVPISYSPTNITISAPQSGTTQISPQFSPDISLPDVDIELLMQQIIQQLSDSGTGDTTTVIPPTEPGEEPEIQLLEPDPPHTGIGDTPVEELPQVDVRSMWHVYNPSVSELAALGNWLWSTNVLDVLIRTFANPLESVMGVHALYAEPSVSSSQPVVVGPLTSNISSLVVSSQYTEVDCGSVWVTEYFGNVFDYEPYTSISLFLPFVGIVPLDISEVMRAEISIRYNVDCYTGACIAMVSVTRDGAGGVLYQFPGNCAVEYPVSGASYSRMLQSMISAATSALSAGVASGGYPVMGALAAGSSFMSGGQKIKVGHSGSFASNVGAMGSKVPYLIITRPQINMARNFEKYDGYSSNFTTQLSACKGYTKCKEVHLNCPGAFKSELDEIENLLRSGVIFPSS